MSVTAHSDIDQIRELRARYCRLADTKRWEAMADLFTDDAVMHFHRPDGTLSHSVTAAEFPASVGGRVGTGQPVHHVFSHEIEFTSDSTASGVWAMEDYVFYDRQADSAAPFTRMHGLGHYHDTYRKVDDVWRIAGFKLSRLRIDITD
ncbi:hypothetical protein C6Y14_12445 [Streptomyces dioscori]|uniref:SnoaL-like domain-containing protein n=1 Tax=Streptomyces dioscori TaxID=2109333 RepID=A0A2P8Q9Q4_9ACTN|nr:nuclear transport factor 2 family protein [Streptomyces dioscori]PSM42982.1 hypothetical protein C6Y14_12445 [Streptomyces dioscori]